MITNNAADFLESSLLPIELSVVIPCFNEAGTVEELYRRLSYILILNKIKAEIIFVDDGSSDNTLNNIKTIINQDIPIKYISFSRNFGHQKALKAGFQKATGKVVITMDSDLQHPPELIPELISQWKKGYDIVNTIRIRETNGRLFKKLSAKLFYKFINLISETEIKAGAADFRLLDRKVVNVLNACHEEYLFLRGMTSWCGFRTCEIEYEAQQRFSGKSKYSLKKMISFALCGITSFSIKPLRLAILLAGVFILLSLCEIVYAIYIVLFTNNSVSGWASLAILISLLGAAILFTLGIIGEYLGKLFIESKKRPEYIIKEEN